jgi:hypothetical protein
MSLAVTPGAGRPSSTIRSDCGTVSRTAPVMKGRVRIGPDHHLAREGVVLGHHGVRNARDVGAVVGGGLRLGQRAVAAQSIGRHEIALCLDHAVHVGHQAAAHVRRALLHIGRVVLEHDDARRIVQGERPAEGGVQHVRGHAGVVLVDEAPVRLHEGAIAGRGVGRGQLGGQRVAIDDLLEQRARPGARVGRAPDPAHVGLAEAQQAAAAQDRAGQRVASRHQFVERDRIARSDAVDQAEVGGGEEPDVVGVLTVDALEALGDDQSDAGEPFRRRTVFARRAFAIALAGDHHLDARGADRADADGPLAGCLEAHVWVAAERVVVVGEDRDRRDLVGRDVVAQGPGVAQGHGPAGQDLADRLGRPAQEKDSRKESQRRLVGGSTGRRKGCHAPMLAGRGGAAKRRNGTGALARREILVYPRNASINACTTRGCGVRCSA